ncbi:MAG: FAD:protein FMN transferase, partial [Symbiobacteriaceae bacterium]
MRAPARPGRADGRLSVTAGGEIAGGELLRLAFRAMDTDIEALVEVPPGRRRDAERLLAWTRDWFVLLERRLSRFRPDSDVTRMNRHAGAGPVRVGGLTAAILARALDLAAWSGGLFDPACQAAMEAAGYDRPYAELRGARAGARRDAPGPRQEARPFLGSYRAVVLDRRARTVQLPAGTGVDLGGIAKGWAADVAVRVLATVGPALVNAGG